MLKMADNSRKRSRKSKLVPRDCADTVEDDSVLQEPAQKKLILDKIKKEPDNYVPPETAHEFSVNVEVEDVDEAVPEEQSSSYMQYLFSLSKESQSTEPMETFEFADNSLLLENKLKFEEEIEDNNCFLDVKKVQKMLETLHKKYPNDSEAVMHARNQWGKVFDERCSFETRKSSLDCQLQDVLKLWRMWSLSVRNRDSPFSYKCYICTNAWWSYSEFKTHLTLHEDCKLNIETQHQECNIIAYEGNVPGYKEVYIHGKCLKCAKTYDHHLTNRKPSEPFYYCNYCEEKMFTCSALAKHEGICNANPIRVLSISQDGKGYKFSDFSCQLCQTVFLSNTDLTEHMVICHNVRSDEPIITKLKTCTLCSRSYSTFQYHICLKKNLIYECPHCSTKFQNKLMMETHLNMWNKVVRCRVCDKFLVRGCMAAEHYALHSENFTLVHRCLVCRKNLKVFTDDESMRQHKIRSHNRVNSKRPLWDKIIMAKIMLQQCMLDPSAKRTMPTILRKSLPVSDKLTSQNPAPVTSRSPRPNPVGPKTTRGEPMQKVRVYKKPVETYKETQNITICHDEINEATEVTHNITISEDTTNVATKEMPLDNEVKIQVLKKDKNIKKTSKPQMVETICHEISETTDAMPPEDTVKIKEEKDNDKTKDSETTDSNKLPENDPLESTNIAIKIEKTTVDEFETTIPEQVAKKETERTKDLPKLMEELNEFLDIKPDIIRVKEEKLSDDEDPMVKIPKIDTIATPSDLTKVFASSSTFAEEVTENSEHSKVFQVSKSILKSATIKQEIKEEPDDDDDLVIITDIKQESVTSDNSEISVLNLEPEVILKAGYRKRKIYKCNKCDYSGYHREYKEHMNNHCMTPKTSNDNKKEEETSQLIFKCTKCGSKFANIKRYALHFEKHGYRYMSCPQCNTGFDSVTKLITHVNSHIKSQFVRMLVICDVDDKETKVYQCKTCKEIQKGSEKYFEHWEKHLKLNQKLVAEPCVEEVEKESRSEQALDPQMLKKVIAHLCQQEKTEVQRLKTCIVCDRMFERRNDLKRHLIEHLLEDAYANMSSEQMLKCQICRDLHKKADLYKKHMRDHASLPIYQCSLCNKTFSDSSNFTKHKKIHNIKVFVCDICSKKFQAKISLEKHMEMHMNTEPIKCDRCSRLFYDSSFYRRHYRQHHDKLAYRHKCFVCKEKFNCLREKWDHMWEVHKQRKDNADCPICHRSYRKFSDVKKHASQEHGISLTASDVWELVNKHYQMERDLHDAEETEKERTREKEQKAKEKEVKVKEEVDSDDDCLIIEEERETLVVFD